ncbi:hypothetical protein [Flavobacterium sp.]|uniref:hypothetical protein n=1 Tax=Flavobacterium sp. TaxID=239 RepID=UPI00286C2546|nr:hypothetical protein [Flavobacterium sp.]
MGKLDGIIKIQGTLDNLTFYKSADGHFVRTKGGVSKNRIKNDPAFQRTRENGTEFGHSASAAKLLRTGVGIMLFHAKDRRLSSRLLGIMAQIKNLDSRSARGERKVALGLTTAEGKQLLKGFDFNAQAALNSIFYPPLVLDTGSGKVTIADFVPKQQILAPEGATHFSLQSAFLNLDFATGIFETTYSPVDNHIIDNTAISVNLNPSGVPAGTGIAFYLMLIEFFQEVNGVQYVLNNGSYNVLNILDVV